MMSDSRQVRPLLEAGTFLLFSCVWHASGIIREHYFAIFSSTKLFFSFLTQLFSVSQEGPLGNGQNLNPARGALIHPCAFLERSTAWKIQAAT